MTGGFIGVFGSDCIARASEKQVINMGGQKIIQKLNGERIKERAIAAQKGAEYTMRRYGWKVDGPLFQLTLKSDLKSI